MQAPARRTPKYAKSFSHRIGTRLLSRRNPLSPQEISDRELLELLTGSAPAAQTLHEHFGSLKELARFGGEHGFAPLSGYPGVTPNVVAKLEAWLEGIGRVVQ
ncbi:hypothetical protein [Meiothermus granaticius]|uniref:Uncharacterized protein n=1 Tax=Meiothermus granaticius NBRC 107808 TaxID=1227551 RepID=A0A399F4V5_9DEIN|nr:hypothetical protein [Meiothermus granaticius]RIH90686.1 hypothetical protein Mgrana_03198 [Meiothermus granaticius NBRC 107808]GEM88468.1 hypothetical protein MGR01S_30930 [Meiothermus granaticius NBRC 107808]